jgi:hypothetical protein
VRTDAPVYMCEQGRGGRGGCGFRSVISTVIHTQIRQSHGVGQRLSGRVVSFDAPVYMREQGRG